jgi:hypothetical protein
MDTNGGGVKDGDATLAVFPRVVKIEHESLDFWVHVMLERRNYGEQSDRA